MKQSNTINNYFDLIINNEVKDIQEHKKFLHKCDRRETNFDQKCICGFAAIHYAAYYGYLDLLSQLINHEVNVLTQNNFEYITEDQQNYKIGKNSSFLIVALKNKQPDIVQYCVDHWEKCSNIIGKISDSNITILIQSLYDDFESFTQLLNKDDLIDKEFTLIQQGGKHPLYTAAFFGQEQKVKKIIEIIDNNEQFKEFTYSKLMQTNSRGRYLLNSITGTLDYNMYTDIRQSRIRLLQILNKTVIEAFKYCYQTKKYKKFAETYALDNQLNIKEIFEESSSETSDSSGAQNISQQHEICQNPPVAKEDSENLEPTEEWNEGQNAQDRRRHSRKPQKSGFGCIRFQDEKQLKPDQIIKIIKSDNVNELLYHNEQISNYSTNCSESLQNAIAGFSSIQYAVLYNSYNCFLQLFSKYYNQIVIQRTEIEFQKGKKLVSCFVEQNTDLLQLAIILGHDSIIRLIQQQVCDDDEMKQFFFLRITPLKVRQYIDIFGQSKYEGYLEFCFILTQEQFIEQFHQLSENEGLITSLVNNQQLFNCLLSISQLDYVLENETHCNSQLLLLQIILIKQIILYCQQKWGQCDYYQEMYVKVCRILFKLHQNKFQEIENSQLQIEFLKLFTLSVKVNLEKLNILNEKQLK